MKPILTLCIGLLASLLLQAQIPTTALQGEYKFTQGSLLDGFGSQPLSQTGTALTQVPNRASGANRAISLNGDHLQRSGTTGNSFSVSFWIKTSTTDANKRVIIDQSERATEAEGSAETGWYVYLQDGKINVAGNFQWYHNNNTVVGALGYMGWHQVVANSVISDGAWHHVTVTNVAFAGSWYNAPYQRYDRIVSNTYSIYIDNVLVITQGAVKNMGNATNPQMRRFITNVTPITIGNSQSANSTNRFTEAIDDLRYYTATLSAADVTALYSETACAGSTGVTAATQDITLYLDADGNATLSPGQIDNGSANTCGDPLTFSLDKTSFTCADLGANVVSLTAEDAEGNSDVATATVTVAPTVVVSTLATTLVVELDANGTFTLAPEDIDAGTSASCGTAGLNYSLDKTDFTCADAGNNIVVTLTVTDAYGNSETGTTTVRAEDSIAPEALAQNISVQLDAVTGVATVTPAQIDNGSTDNCTVNLSLSQTEFGCADIGENEVTLTVTDNRGNSSQAIAIVSVSSIVEEETLSTVATSFCPDGSSGAIVSTGSSVAGVNYYLRNSADSSVVDGPIAGTGSALDFSTGNLSETSTFHLYAETESSGGANSMALDFDGVNDKVEIPFAGQLLGTSEFTIEMWVFPTKSSYSRLVTRFGGGAVVAGDVLVDTYSPLNNGRGLRFFMGKSNATNSTFSVDNVLTLSSWNHVAATFESGTMTLYVNGVQVGTGALGETTVPNSSASWVLGEDRGGTNPEFFAGKMDEVRFWNVARSAAEILADKDNCLSGNETGLTAYYTFDQGANSSTLTDLAGSSPGNLMNMDPANDWVAGASISCPQICGVQLATEITIGDTLAPTVITQNISLFLDASGQATLLASDINNGSSDACTAANALLLRIDKSDFTCADLGENIVSLTVEDASGNQSSAVATVTVLDETAPTALAQAITIQLDGNDSATITATDINAGSSDTCTDAVNLVLSLDKSTFSCADVGEVTVTLTVEDASGNQSTAEAIVTVTESVAPVAIAQAVSIQLDANGNANLEASALNNGSTDNCTEANGLVFSVDKSSFTCTDLGENTVTLTVADASGNQSSTTAVVTVQDLVAPTVLTKNIIVNLDEAGVATISAVQVNNGSSDNCTAQSDLSLSVDISSFTVDNLGDNTVILTVSDASGNSSTGTAVVIVEQKTNQSITFAALTDMSYGDSDLTLSATASSGLEVTYTVSGPASLSGNNLHLTGVGTVTVEANQAGNTEFAAAPTVVRSFTVHAAELLVAVDNQSITYGEALPEYTYQISGFVNGEEASVLSTQPQVSSTATESSDAGTYEITATGAEAANYAISYEVGTLTINKANQTVTITAIAQQSIEAGTITLEASATSGLELSFAVLSGPATVAGNQLTLSGTPGTVVVEASQAGNQNYEAASAQTSFTVINPNNPCDGFAVNLTEQSNNLCAGEANGSITVQVTGGTEPYTFSWNNGASSQNLTALAAGNYTLTVTDANACTVSLSASITEPEVLEANFTAQPQTDGETPNGSIDLTVSGGTAPYTYAWNNESTEEDQNGLSAGDYSVTITDANGCGINLSITVADEIEVVSGLADKSFGIKVYPNPASAYVYLASEKAEGGEIWLMNLHGQIVQKHKAESLQEYRLDISGLRAGTYLLRIARGAEAQVLKIQVE